MNDYELNEGELVMHVIRKHWLIFIGELLPYALILIAPFALPKLLMLAPPFAAFLPYFDYSAQVPRLLLGLWLIIFWTVGWGAFTRYFLNAWILTTERIINVKQKRFFSREVSSILLTRVQDVTTDVTGVLASLLDVGDIKVQSAGEDEEFVMHGIPLPELMRDLILKHVPRVSPDHTGV